MSAGACLNLAVALFCALCSIRDRNSITWATVNAGFAALNLGVGLGQL